MKLEVQGWLMLDKPEGISSAAALNKIKKFVKPDKIGHAGTLDPFASGLLMVAVGKATKLIQYSMAQEKTYKFSIKWGVSTDSIDPTGNIVATSCDRPKISQIIEFISSNHGMILQEPPIYSAININGRRAYDIARSGVDFSIESRPVNIKELKLLSHTKEESEFFLRCGKGFYVRSLVRDIAKYCSVYGYTSKLRRTSVGNFTVENAISVDYILEKVKCREDVAALLIKPYSVLEGMSIYIASHEEIKLIRHGRKIRAKAVNSIAENCEVAVHDNLNGELIGICIQTGGYLHPKKILSTLNAEAYREI
ncbi:tRNA pseudouridine(55) synthase TruB [Candidatus Lariskella endosymbiont of Hedychridium roseum]|uniref:tRNA pseudouridine(55) synthase TruB n=1 Tax=Candidatus Lariskella endosymbiont of Hedychridium roseum TaxID=3077949 RepID=UPI0030D36A12